MLIRQTSIAWMLATAVGCTAEAPSASSDAPGLPPDSLVRRDVAIDAMRGGETPVVPRHATADLVFRADRVYDGDRGAPNPFVDVSLTVRLTDPGGTARTVRAFFDGDGEGGAEGSTFVARVCPDSPGIWRWSASGDVPGVDGLDGRFECAGVLEGAFGRGPIVTGAEDPTHVAHADGTPVYLVGKFLDRGAPEPIRFSHTLLSERLSAEDRRALIDRHVALGLNKMNVYVANRGDYGGISTTPWRGEADDPDRSRFDLARWHRYEHWVRELREDGFFTMMWFFADDSGFGHLPTVDRDRLIQYGMSRLSGYAHTAFVLCLEWQEGWTPAEVTHHLGVMRAENPWDRLTSVHGTTGDVAFANEPWNDLLILQAGNQASADTVLAMTLRNRVAAPKPLLVEEFGWGKPSDELRVKTWTALLAGAAGIGTGTTFEIVTPIISRWPMTTFEPAPAVASGDGVVTARGRDGLTVVLAPRGGSIEVNLPAGVTEGATATWIDPRTGERRDAIASGDTRRHYEAPSTEDWLLELVPGARTSR